MAADALLDAAGVALAAAETTTDPKEERRKLHLFELYMSAAGAEPTVTG